MSAKVHFGTRDLSCGALCLTDCQRPHHPWERGTNENANGLIRQYLPKGQSMARVIQQQYDDIARKLNTRPGKRYGYETPQQRLFGG